MFRFQGENVLERSSELIHSGEVSKSFNGTTAQERVCFLFDHQLIYCKKVCLDLTGTPSSSSFNTQVFQSRLYYANNLEAVAHVTRREHVGTGHYSSWRWDKNHIDPHIISITSVWVVDTHLINNTSIAISLEIVLTVIIVHQDILRKNGLTYKGRIDMDLAEVEWLDDGVGKQLAS